MRYQISKEVPVELQQKKPRRDKGVVLFSARDEFCLAWIADQYAVRLDQIQRLLSLWPMGKVKNKERGLAPTTVKDQISRWERAGWIEYQRVLANQPGWAWITRKGLQVLDWDDFYTARAPAYSRLMHIYAVNQVRFLSDQRGYTWKSEREYRMDLEEAQKGESTGPIPDGIVTGEKIGTVAIEVELSSKKPADLAKKMEELTDCIGRDDRYKFPRIWFHVPDEQGRQAAERARTGLIEQDQKRIDIVVLPGLIA
jgi:hypothetical protein